MKSPKTDVAALYRLLFPRQDGAKDPADLAERLTLLSSLGESIFVEAGAGSGKTACMSARLVALIAAGAAECGEIAAVTFTRKAAAEMRERFQGYLEILAAKGSGAEKERADRAIAGLDAAFIGTIHAFCARILRERPVEADLAPDFSELEEDEDKIAAARNWREFCATFPSGPVEAAAAQKLRERGIGLAELESIYKTLCRFPEIEFPEPAASRRTDRVPRYDRVPDARPGDVKAMVAEACELAAGVWAAVRETKLGAAYLREIGSDQNIFTISERIVDGRGYLPRSPHLLAEMLRAVQNVAFELDKKGENQYPVKNRRDLKKDPNPRAAEGVSRLDENFSGWQALLKPGGPGDGFIKGVFVWRYTPAIGVAKIAARRYEIYRRTNGLVNFADLLLRTRNLLRDNPAARAEMAKKYKRVLVDEFQDTDPLQAEIVMLLCGDDPKGGAKRWDDRAIRPGALVVVGDPKQSIYRFRRADIEVFAAMRAVFERPSGARTVRLSTNFRCLPGVAAFANGVAEGLFGGAAKPGIFQARYEPMLPFRGGRDSGTGIATLTTTGTLRSKDRLVAEEAARIAKFILAAVGGGTFLGRASWSDFLIVTRYKGKLAFYVEALCALGIPVEATGAGDLGRSVAHQALVQACNAIADPDNPVMLVGVLRGPLCGASDRELMEWAGAGGGFSFYAATPEGVGRGTSARFEALFSSLRSLRAATRALPPAAAVERIVSDLGIRRLALSSSTPSQSLGGIEKTLEKVRGAAATGGLSFEDAARLIAEIGIDEDAMSMEPGRADAVRVMNLHQVKGLEARVVFLAAPSETPRDHAPEVVIDRESGRGFAAVRVSRGEYQTKDVALPPGWDGMSEREAAQIEAEEDRLRYVAMTRARDLLVVSIFRNEKGEPGKTYGWMPLADRAIQDGVRELPAPDVRYEEPDEQIEMAAFDLAKNSLAVAARPARDVKNISEIGGATPHERGHAVPSEQPLFRGDRPSTVVRSGAGDGARLGPGFGTAMHTVLQAMLDRDAAPTPELARNALTDALDVDPEARLVDEIVSQARAVTKTPLWRRIKAAETRFTEVPMGAPSAGGDATHFGRADLLFKETGKKGWVLVDFKTDDPEGGRAESLKKTYKPQLDEYARIWESVTGEKVAERYILFASSGEAAAV